MIGCLRTRVRKQPIIALYLESENELKFYNLEASLLSILDLLESIFDDSFMTGKFIKPSLLLTPIFRSTPRNVPSTCKEGNRSANNFGSSTTNCLCKSGTQLNKRLARAGPSRTFNISCPVFDCKQAIIPKPSCRVQPATVILQILW